MAAARSVSIASTAIAAVVGVALSWSLRHDLMPAGRRAAAPAAPTGSSAHRPFAMAPTVDPRRDLPGEVSRRILALHDSTEQIREVDADGHETSEPTSSESARAHRLAELPLNHLGLVVDHLDVDGPLPTDDEMRAYRGVLVWFADDRMRDPARYLEWIVAQRAAGRRLVAMERLGAAEDLEGRPTDPALVARAMRALGGTDLGDPTDDPSVIAVEWADPAVIGFERKLPARLDSYRRYRALPGGAVHLQLERTDRPESTSDVVWTGPGGGFVAATLATTEDRLGERWVTRWLVDPFRFFEAAFDVAGWLRPDFTTLNGQRIFYSQIDGDGMEQTTELDYKTRCGAVVRDEILARFPYPFTVSVVVGYTAPPPLGRGSELDVEVARSIFALDNVEIASHGLAHPMNWRGDGKVGLSVPDLPGYTLSGETEIAQSVAYIDEVLAPPGKRCAVMLWTGWCNPTSDQLEVAYRLGLRNLNGGDPRMDAHFPSYAHLVAPVHVVGETFQYLTSAANDYILTDGWEPPYYRFRNVIDTFERSGSPRRIVPVDVYFHFYVARNLSGLTGLREIMEWVERQPLAPIFASEYVDVVRDFHWARLARDGDRWTVRKGPALRTLRADDPSLHVDPARSRGVLGYLQDPALGVTYVHLDGSTEAVVQLASGPPERPYLVRASHAVDELELDDRGFSFVTRGPGTRTFEFGGLEAGAAYRVDGVVVTADASGRLRLRLAGGRADAVAVEVRR